MNEIFYLSTHIQYNKNRQRAELCRSDCYSNTILIPKSIVSVAEIPHLLKWLGQLNISYELQSMHFLCWRQSRWQGGGEVNWPEQRVDDDGSGRRQALTDDTILQRTVHLTHKDPSQLHIRPVQLPGHTRRTVATINVKSKQAAHTRLPSAGFRSWSRFLAVSLQVTWVINPAVGCHYFLPGLQSPPQPLRGLLPISLLGEQRYDGCEQFA